MPTPATCACPKARHRHGTNRMYAIHACRCMNCRIAHSETMARYRKNKGPRLVPTAETASLLSAYLAEGHTMAAISDVTTLSERHLWKIRTGTAPNVQVGVAELVREARKHLGEPTGRRIDATGTRRRLQALATMGWGTVAVATETGVHRNIAQSIRSGQTNGCSAETRRKVQEFYDAHWDEDPHAPTLGAQQGIARTKNLAARNGWLPPLAWDDDRIDDPNYAPNVTVIARGRFDQATERLDELTHLVGSGVPAHQAAERAGYPTRKAAYEAAKHRGLLNLAAQLIESAA